MVETWGCIDTGSFGNYCTQDQIDMNAPFYPSEIQGKHWLPPLGLATALHLLLLLAIIYAPGASHLRPEVKSIHLVSIIDLVEPGKNEVEQGRIVQTPLSPPVIRKSPKPSERVRTETAIFQAKSSNPAQAISQQPQPAIEVNVYGQGQAANADPSEEPGEKREISSLDNSGAATGNGIVSDVASLKAGAEGRESTRKRYLAGLLAHIEAHKFYPLAARRRRLEGTVQVRFTLEAGGMISNLEVSDGEPILEQAALEAVEHAMPLPAPKGAAQTPLPISYRMSFQLR
ncbi:MAG: hypothetical protein A2512_03060 [Deltaproteobacteria bacterium RIFOXYD12_FULL_56_24]|nr:MAG: hypothetical protein A2512_03060 [Deltaproteobacteria bacterium RIFOXYD12_FULL_56_24]